MTKPDLPSAEMLRKLLRYDAETGKLFWLPRSPDMFGGLCLVSNQSCNRWNLRYSGKAAFTCDNGMGYLVGSIFGRQTYAHRVVWAICYNEWPNGQIDHINGEKSDNRIENLRLVTQTQNARNQKRHKNNKSGFLGVHWEPSKNKWRARINDDTGRKHLGFFDSKNDAILAVKLARSDAGYHENHGKG